MGLGLGLAATMAASLSRFSSEAPEKPVVREAMLESSIWFGLGSQSGLGLGLGLG